MSYPLLTIHYIAPILSSSLVGVGAGYLTAIGFSWIDIRSHSRSHSIWMGALSPYVLFSNTLDMGMWADWHWTDSWNMEHSSMMGWCCWGRLQNSNKDWSAFCLGSSQDLGSWDGVSSSDDEEGGESVTPWCLCWCLLNIDFDDQFLVELSL